MAKLVYGSASTGRVVNVVSAPDGALDDVWVWSVPDGTVVNVGDTFDTKDPQIDAGDVPAMKLTFRHENLIRQLIRALRASSTAANTAATNAGLPTAANSADVTQVQFRDFAKTLLP